MKLPSFSEFIGEGAAPGTVEYYANDPKDSWNDTNIKLVLERKIDSNTAIYRLETDTWFRRFEGVGKGYGVMLRKFKISGSPRKIPTNWVVGPHNVVLPILVEFMPNSDSDNPEMYEKAEGYLILGNRQNPGFEMMQILTPSDIEEYVRKNIPNYYP
jgi:hypothetical protein